MSKYSLWLIILIEGFVTISAEILTIRQILPIAGGSVIVTSLIIGVFLLFLAYGYRRGGQQRSDYHDILKKNFSLAAFLLGIGLSYVFIRLFFALFGVALTQHILWMLTLYLLSITAPLTYILGQTVPITMNLLKQMDKKENIQTAEAEMVGNIGGNILHLSTMGSFLGAILTSLLLMNFLGVAWTIVVNYLCLFFITVLLMKNKWSESFRMIALSLGLVLVYILNVHFEKQLFVKTNAYANYEIVQYNNGKVLLTNESVSSFITPEKKGFPYIELVKRILFSDLQLRNKDILVLGAGGFSLSAEETYQNRFTYVDIDKDIEKIVKDHFLSNPAGKLVTQDARSFLNQNQDKFDVIFTDVYSSARTIPAHLLTQEYFISINRALRSEGMAIANIIAKPTLQDDYSQKIDNTIRSVFPQCMVIPSHYTKEVHNILYVCQKNTKLKTANLYTDDLNQATLDFFNLMKDIGSSYGLFSRRQTGD